MEHKCWQYVLRKSISRSFFKINFFLNVRMWLWSKYHVYFPSLASLSLMPFSTLQKKKKAYLLPILNLRRLHFPRLYKDYGVPNKGQFKILVSVKPPLIKTLFGSLWHLKKNDFKKEVVKYIYIYFFFTSYDYLKLGW